MRRSRRGFTLLEVLVATTIMAVAVGTLLATLTTSLRNGSRVLEADRAALMAKRTLDDLLAQPVLPVGQVLQGDWNETKTGVPGGWRARVEPFESLPNTPARLGGLGRVVVEVWWQSGGQRRTFVLEGYRRLPPAD